MVYQLQPKNRRNQNREFVAVKTVVFAAKTHRMVNSTVYVNLTLAVAYVTSLRNVSGDRVFSVPCLSFH